MTVKSIFYFHGFNSASKDANGNLFDRSKLNFISSQCKKNGIVFDAPNIDFTQFADSINLIEKEISHSLNSGHKVLVMGTSLGGFISEYLGRKFSIPAILINPAINPEKSLQSYIQVPAVKLENFATGLEYDWNIEHCKVFDAFTNLNKSSSTNAPRVVMLDMADEIIDAHITAKLYADNSQVIQFEGGNHRFTHIEETWPVIEDMLGLS